MDDTMAPPSKRRKLLEPAQDVAQQPEIATKPSTPPFSHGVEHISATKPAQALYARPSPHHIEELHLEIQTRSVPSAEEQIRLLRRQGTAALTDIITTNSEAEVVVAVTAMVDALGSTTALTTAAVTVEVPDFSSLVGTSTTTAVVSTDSAEPTASSSQETSAEPTSSSAQEISAEPSSSTAQESSPEPTSSSGPSQSEPASTSNDSRTSNTSSSTNAPASSSSASDTSSPTYAVSPASENGTDSDTQSASQSESSTESETGSSVVPSSTTGSAPASYGPASYGASSSQDTATLESSTSSNSTVPISTSASSQSQTSQTAFTPTDSGLSGQTGSASSRNSLNLTTSASTSTSGSVMLVSDFTANYASSTSESASQSTDSSSSIDLNLLYLLTQTDGEVATLTRSDEPFTTSLSGGSEIVVPASSSAASDSRTPASSVSAYVTTISNDQTTMRSTAFSTASPSSTHSSSDDPDGVGLAGVAGDGASATSNGVSTTSAPADTNDGDDDPAPAGTIAGGVVGGAAGLALVALIILLFLRRYKKRAQLGHLALPANAAGPAGGANAGSSSGGRGMAERAGLMPLVGAVPALFRHQNRSQNSGSETGERGFQRVAGRKLPSAFSEGMTGPPQPTMSPPPTMPLVGDDGHERNLSSHSFYRDSAGFYGGDGSTATSPNPFSDSNLPATVAGGTAAQQMVMSPGPQRRPTIHAPKSNVQEPSVATSGTPSWTPSYTATFARSETPASLDSGRNSRFTEEV